jgi:hypothetical protein
MASFPDAIVVVDHVHAIWVANMMVGQVRRQVQQATLGHRGRKSDPLYRIPQAAVDRCRAAHPAGTGSASGRPCRR